MANERDDRGKGQPQPQVQTVQPNGEVAALREMLDEQRKTTNALMAQMAAIMEKLASAPANAGPSPGATVEKMIAEDMLKQRQQQAWFDAEQKFVTTVKSDRRTQIEANKRYKDGAQLWRIQVGWCPPVIIRAQDKEHARGRYDLICGIQWVRRDDNNPSRTDYNYTNVTDDPAARQEAGMTREGALELAARAAA
jgi:hypothetical protein